MRILVHRRNGGLGDVVCMLPAIAALRAKWPAARIDVALSAEFADWLRPRLDGVRVLAWDYRKFRPRWRRLLETAYDVTFDLSGPDAVVGDAEPNRIEYFARACGVQLRSPVPSCRILAHERKWARNWLEGRGIDAGPGRLVCLHLKSARPAKDWPLDKMRELARRLLERGARVVGLERTVRLDIAGAADATGLDLGQAAALIAACDVLIGPDSGPMHLAAAVGTLCIALFGPTSPHVILKHYGATHSGVRRPRAAEITVDELLAKIGELQGRRGTQPNRGRRASARGRIETAQESCPPGGRLAREEKRNGGNRDHHGNQRVA